MKRFALLGLVLLTPLLTACDQIKFPGFSSREDSASTVPPPPERVDLQATEETGETSGTSTERAALETTTRIEPNVGSTPSSIDLHFNGITSLASINAVRCAPSSELTMTLAEMTGARPATRRVTPQTVNGTDVTTAAFPGIVKMEPRRALDNGGISSGHCGATRIAERWFVTASHCLDDTYDEIDLISTETSLSDPRAIRVQATQSLCHAGYGGANGQYANDIALVSISEEDVDTLSHVPIADYSALPQTLSMVNFPRARMAGWGLTGFDEGLSDTLKSASLALVSIGPAAIIVASQETSGPCIGDSGGPLLIDGSDGSAHLVGVLSVVEQNRTTGEFCKGDYNARYTNLEGFRNWITTVTNVCTGKPELCDR